MFLSYDRTPKQTELLTYELSRIRIKIKWILSTNKTKKVLRYELKYSQKNESGSKLITYQKIFFQKVYRQSDRWLSFNFLLQHANWELCRIQSGSWLRAFSLEQNILAFAQKRIRKKADFTSKDFFSGSA